MHIYILIAKVRERTIKMAHNARQDRETQAEKSAFSKQMALLCTEDTDIQNGIKTMILIVN